MIKKVFTVFDEKSEAYLQPFFMDTIGQATRAITDCCNDPNHAFNRHTSDYTLFLLGEFDDLTGQFITDQKKSLGCLIEFKTQTEIFDDRQLKLVEGDN